MSHYMGLFLSKHQTQTGFRKGYNTQYCFLEIFEKWKSAFDKGKFFVVFLTDLFKIFDCLSHDLLLVKLHAYGFCLSTLKSIQHIVLGKKYFLGVPQGSILGTLLFNIFLFDLFFSMNETDFDIYSDDNTPLQMIILKIKYLVIN